MLKALLISILFLISNSAFASPEEVIYKFLSPNGNQDKESYYHGEMLEYFLNKPTIGESLTSDTDVDSRNIFQSKTRSVYAVTLTKDNADFNLYIHLFKDKEDWKITFIRSLALTGIYHMLIKEIDEKLVKTEEDNWQYQNARLTISSDKELKKYLTDNLNEFNALITAYKEGGTSKDIESLSKELYLNLVQTGSGFIELNIGGMVDNSVGYLYVTNEKNPPKMSDNGYIYIEQISDHWFIYKTT